MQSIMVQHHVFVKAAIMDVLCKKQDGPTMGWLHERLKYMPATLV
jgi:hypothetical protein